MAYSGQRLSSRQIGFMKERISMIYYLGYYSCNSIDDENRYTSAPAANKMSYVISALSDILDNECTVVSPSETRSRSIVKRSLKKLSNHISLKTFPSIYSPFLPIRCFGHLLTKLYLNLYLLTRIKENDTVIVYHSMALMKVVKRLKRITKCELIIEAEELYSDVHENEGLRKKEINYLKLADKYIVITELLNKEINSDNKPKTILHGNYKEVSKCSDKFCDGKIHVVYAGTFNPIKGGATSAIGAAEFLDENYVLHILGGGSKAEVENVVRKIEKISLVTKCKIVYDGFIKGKEFDKFIQSCHIGLSTQQPNGKYNASSFPSKVLMYMSNGLPVVSVRIPAIESSNVGEYVYYYNEATPQSIAKAIRAVPSNQSSLIYARLKELDLNFKNELTELLSK